MEETKLDVEQIYYVLKKLTGSIHAIGETNHDNQAYENLMLFDEVFGRMYHEIVEEAEKHNIYEGSVSRNGNYALTILENLKEHLDYVLSELKDVSE